MEDKRRVEIGLMSTIILFVGNTLQEHCRVMCILHCATYSSVGSIHKPQSEFNKVPSFTIRKKKNYEINNNKCYLLTPDLTLKYMLSISCYGTYL